MTLSISKLHVAVGNKEIIKGINLSIKNGEVHVLMGPNGSGKSTLSFALMGHPTYRITGGEILFGRINLLPLSPEERARLGVFLAFQKPLSIPGVSIINFLRTAYLSVHNSGKKSKIEKTFSVREFLDLLREKAELFYIKESFLKREVNEGFSGGEMKKLEMLTMAVLSPSFAILDEIDTGLDIDALRIVAFGIEQLRKDTGILLITHYQRILRYLRPDFVHVMINGKIVASGDATLAKQLEKTGYAIYEKS